MFKFDVFHVICYMKKFLKKCSIVILLDTTENTHLISMMLTVTVIGAVPVPTWYYYLHCHNLI